MRLFYALIIFFLGLGLVKYRERVQSFTGTIGFAEQYLGVGGTFTFYILVGIGAMFFSILYLTGTFDSIAFFIGKFFFVGTQQ